MPTKPDGGPAFPIINPATGVLYAEGATLRDWFAGQALVGLMSDPGMRPSDIAEFEHIAMRLYQVADAMLAERAK